MRRGLLLLAATVVAASGRGRGGVSAPGLDGHRDMPAGTTQHPPLQSVHPERWLRRERGGELDPGTEGLPHPEQVGWATTALACMHEHNVEFHGDSTVLSVFAALCRRATGQEPSCKAAPGDGNPGPDPQAPTTPEASPLLTQPDGGQRRGEPSVVQHGRASAETLQQQVMEQSFCTCGASAGEAWRFHMNYLHGTSPADVAHFLGHIAGTMPTARPSVTLVTSLGYHLHSSNYTTMARTLFHLRQGLRSLPSVSRVAFLLRHPVDTSVLTGDRAWMVAAHASEVISIVNALTQAVLGNAGVAIVDTVTPLLDSQHENMAVGDAFHLGVDAPAWPAILAELARLVVSDETPHPAPIPWHTLTGNPSATLTVLAAYWVGSAAQHVFSQSQVRQPTRDVLCLRLDNEVVVQW